MDSMVFVALRVAPAAVLTHQVCLGGIQQQQQRRSG
jgi:hypothetical protein